MQNCKYANVQVCKCESMQMCKYANVQVNKCVSKYEVCNCEHAAYGDRPCLPIFLHILPLTPSPFLTFSQVHRNVLDLIYAQTIFWFSYFFAPLMTVVSVCFYFLIFYIKRFALYNSVPSRRSYKAASMVVVVVDVVFVAVVVVVDVVVAIS